MPAPGGGVGLPGRVPTQFVGAGLSAGVPAPLHWELELGRVVVNELTIGATLWK